ncbi:peptidoglycan-binding protein [Sagittula marina]|nr:peptidoglycan-binding protein [Sagittula marina]
MPSHLKYLVFALALAGQTAFGQTAPDAEQFYIQVEARTSLTGAQSSVRRFSRTLGNVNGFSLGGGWYGVAVGPFADRDEAEAFLGQMMVNGDIPPDSYIESSNVYGRQFWPVGAQVTQDAATEESAADVSELRQQLAEDATDLTERTREAIVQDAEEPAPVTDEAVVESQTPSVRPVDVDEETPREARNSERLLNRDERDALQIALQWAGFYDGRIDGAFGGGTRRSMAAWQDANGLEATGVLTTLQREELLRQYNAVLDGLGMRDYLDNRAGIVMQMPMGVVSFDRYEAPFALFEPTGDLQARVLLISQPGDSRTLNGLYEIMQTLEIVPTEGERSRDQRGFRLTGANDRIVSHTEVGLQNGEIKGFTLIWPAGDEERRTRVLALMQDSYQRVDGVLDPAAVTDDGQSVDLVSGLRVRTPKGNGSGFFIDDRGTVLASSTTVGQCDRVTINGSYDAEVMATDTQLGVSLLRPVDTLSPRGVAQFTVETQRLQSEVAVAGFSFGGVLTAPTLTYGTLEDTQGLAGEETVKRLAMNVMPGDAGGPVFDAGGQVMGMLLPRDTDGGRVLPDQVSFAAKGELIVDFLRANGVQSTVQSSVGTLAPEDLTAQATDMTVLVSCW